MQKFIKRGSSVLALVFVLCLMLGLALPSHAALSRVQGVTSTEGTGTTNTVVFSSTGAGALIVCGVAYDSAQSISTFSDNKGNNYLTNQAFTLSINGASVKFEQYYVPNSASGITLITVTYSASTHGLTVCEEISGAATASPLDTTGGTATALSCTTDCLTNPWSSVATGTTSQANEILIGQAFGNASSNQAFAAGTSWIGGLHVGNGGNGSDFFMEHQIVSSTGTFSATGKDNGGNVSRWAALGAYKEAAAAATGRSLLGVVYH